jgi:hypothetical protein
MASVVQFRHIVFSRFLEQKQNNKGKKKSSPAAESPFQRRSPALTTCQSSESQRQRFEEGLARKEENE